MRTITLFIVIMLQPLTSAAALAPEYQNERDFEVLVNFARSHGKVMATLKSIDFEKFIVHFDNDCEALFERRATLKLPGWAGPAAPLEFKSSTCSLDETETE